MNKKQPQLNRIELKKAFENMTKPGQFIITMSKGQWDGFLDEGYFRQDAILIELDENEIPTVAYKLV